LANGKKSPGKKSKSKLKNFYGVFLILVIIAAIVAFQIWQQNKQNKVEKQEGIAAIVNGEIITKSELDMQYDKIPEQYKAIITKDSYLNQMIAVKLLIQEARKKGIEVTDERANKEIEAIKERELITTDEDFNKLLGNLGLNADELKNRIIEQLMIDMLFNETIDPTIQVTDSMVESFYERYKGDFNNESLDKIRDDVELALRNQLRDGAIQIYIKQLTARADIQMGGEEINETFQVTGDELCEENGKPIIRMFSAKSSVKSQWAKDAFASITSKYNNIVAYHWVLDTGDNLLTDDIEKAIPKDEIAVFKKYSPEGAVPLFVFGCKYARIGNGYEDLALEEKEFQKIIKNLT